MGKVFLNRLGGWSRLWKFLSRNPVFPNVKIQFALYICLINNVYCNRASNNIIIIVYEFLRRSTGNVQAISNIVMQHAVLLASLLRVFILLK